MTSTANRLSLPDRNALKAPFAALHHVALVTNDMEATVRFYRDILGSEIAMAHRQGEHNVRHYFITVAPNTVFAFFEFPDAEMPEHLPPTKPKSGRSLDHISFFLNSHEELDAWKENLEGHGIEYSSMEVPGMVSAIFFPDPNNIVIELMVMPLDELKFPKLDDPEPAY
jgi:catechol 2,3-dioxygenase-like lactoylglutathione lyase family enzyme